MDLTVCPECGQIAEVQHRLVLESTDGPIEHAKIRCVRGHWFFLPVSELPGPACKLREQPVRQGSRQR